jgi:hypothetical protein
MTNEAFSELTLARPFLPFVLHLSDGRSISLSHPELIDYHPDASALVAACGDALEFIDLRSVVAHETVSPGPQPN